MITDRDLMTVNLFEYSATAYAAHPYGRVYMIIRGLTYTVALPPASRILPSRNQKNRPIMSFYRRFEAFANASPPNVYVYIL